MEKEFCYLFKTDKRRVLYVAYSKCFTDEPHLFVRGFGYSTKWKVCEEGGCFQSDTPAAQLYNKWANAGKTITEEQYKEYVADIERLKYIYPHLFARVRENGHYGFCDDEIIKFLKA
jgi:hypothetical protein